MNIVKASALSTAFFLSGCAFDNSGDIMVIGTTSGELDGGAHAGGLDMFLMKYSKSGIRFRCLEYL